MTPLTTAHIIAKLPEIDGWSFSDGFLCKTVITKDFKAAFSLMTRIAFEAEQLNHHPTWENTYNSIQFKLSTHDCAGVSQKDFELAKIIDTITKNAF